MTGSVRTTMVAIGAGRRRSRCARLRPTRKPRRRAAAHQRVPRAWPQRRATTNSSRSTTTAAPTTPWSAASGTGYGVAASDGTTRCSIPNGTVIPARGHYLCVNSVAYSLGAYPAGNGTTATGDATYTTDIPDNAGIALFNNNTGGGNYILANRLDAVGSTSEANTLYKEGTGYPGADAVLDRLLVLPRRLRQERLDHDDGRLHRSARRRTPTTTPPTSSSSTPTAPRRAPASAWARPDRRTSRRRSSATARSPPSCSTPRVAASRPPNRVRDFTSDPAQQLDVRDALASPDGSSTTPAATSPGCASGSSTSPRSRRRRASPTCGRGRRPRSWSRASTTPRPARPRARP